MIDIFTYQLTYSSMALLILAAFMVGMAKTGISGFSMIIVPIVALVFGGKASTGIMLPILIMADLMAVAYYHRHADWHYLKKLFPCAAFGVFIGTLIGDAINDELFKLVMGIIIFISLGLMLWMEKANKEKIPDYIWFALLMGFLGGVTTMIGNLAGAVMALYLMSMRLPKNVFIGTSAWFFLCINVFKVPFHIFTWETITLNSLKLNLLVFPFIALGAICGIFIVKRIPEKPFRWLVISMTAVAAFFMVF